MTNYIYILVLVLASMMVLNCLDSSWDITLLVHFSVVIFLIMSLTIYPEGHRNFNDIKDFIDPICLVNISQYRKVYTADIMSSVVFKSIVYFLKRFSYLHDISIEDSMRLTSLFMGPAISPPNDCKGNNFIFIIIRQTTIVYYLGRAPLNW